MTGNETIPLSDLKEPSNTSACNADKLSHKFMNPSLTFTLSIDINRNQPVVVVTQCKLANHLPIGLVSCVQVRCGACK